MEPPPVAKPQFVPQNSRMHVMDPEVVEIPPPVFRTSKKHKQKKVYHEVIDLDKYDDSADVTVLDEMTNTGIKGKAVKKDSDGSSGYQTKGSVSGSHSIFDRDFDDEQLIHAASDFMDVDDYATLQEYFDGKDVPAGVEATVPWFIDPSLRKEKMINGSKSVYVKPAIESDPSLQKAVDVLGHHDKMGFNFSSSWFHHKSAYNAATSKKKKIASASQDVGSTAENVPFNGKASNRLWLGKKSENDGEAVASGISSHFHDVNQFDPMIPPHVVGPSPWTYGTLPPVQNQVGTSNVLYPSFPANKIHPPVAGPFTPWEYQALIPGLNSTFDDTVHPSVYDPFDNVDMPPEEPVDTHNGEYCYKRKQSVDEEDILAKFKLFKQFDAVEDYSDHHYASKTSSSKPSNKWAKRIQEEWKILENDLPDTIFVRVYESRMDLLRAVIVGAKGTPYHDGLFFFDVFFPSGYPNVPPNVHYHSGGLRLNPNLYDCGKVCLSLLNTWHGGQNEQWLPAMSTMLQVLVSIQALILNEKPYFNEPGWERMNGTPEGERKSYLYNERTFILSLKTMLYTVRRPPKHFKDFVIGHFYKCAHDILSACKACVDGAEVGSLVESGVQKIHMGNQSCSPDFKNSIAGHINHLVKEFTRVGVKDCEKFLSQAKGEVSGVDNKPKTRSRTSHSLFLV